MRNKNKNFVNIITEPEYMNSDYIINFEMDKDDNKIMWLTVCFGNNVFASEIAAKLTRDQMITLNQGVANYLKITM